VNQGLWQETVGEDAHTENLGSHDRYEEGFYAKERESVPVVKRRKESMRVHIGTTEERIYLTLKIASNSTSVLCRKEGQEEADGTKL